MAKIEEKPTLKSTVNDLINDMNLKKKSTADSFDYDQAIDSLVKDLYDGKEFSYDSESDPEWQAAKQEYTKEADRTMRDVLAQGAARTGGIASTAAITAASEARDYTMSGLAEKKAQLRNDAYNRYQQENQAKLQILSVLDDLQDEERNEYLSLLETQENIEKTERDEARAKVSSLMAMGILPSDELLASAGYDDEYAAGLKKNYFESLDTTAMQKFLNEHGAKLTVDGVWGSDTEAAYKKYFGKSSGRQDYFGSSGGGSSGSGSSRGSGSSGGGSSKVGGYTSSELLEAAAAGMSKKDIENALKNRGVDINKETVQADIKWALSK